MRRTGFGGKVAVVTGAGTERDISGATVIRADVTSIADMCGLAAPSFASDASQAITGATLDVNGGQLFT